MQKEKGTSQLIDAKAPMQRLIPVLWWFLINAEKEIHKGVPKGSLADVTSSAFDNSISQFNQKSNPQKQKIIKLECSP